MRDTKKRVSEDQGVRVEPGVIVEPRFFLEMLNRHEREIMAVVGEVLNRDGLARLDLKAIMENRGLGRSNLWHARTDLERRGILRRSRMRGFVQVNPWLLHRSEVFRETLQKQRAMWDTLMAEQYQDEFGDVDLEAR